MYVCNDVMFCRVCMYVCNDVMFCRVCMYVCNDVMVCRVCMYVCNDVMFWTLGNILLSWFIAKDCIPTGKKINYIYENYM